MIEPAEVVKQIKERNPRKLFFYDDNFFISKRRGKELLRADDRRESCRLPFFAQIRIDSVCKNGKVDEELLDLLWNAGCRIVYLGLESVNPATLKEYHKESTHRRHGRRPGSPARNRGIKTHGMFVFGADSDTRESLAMTADFAAGARTEQRPVPGADPAARHPADGSVRGRRAHLHQELEPLRRAPRGLLAQAA